MNEDKGKKTKVDVQTGNRSKDVKKIPVQHLPAINQRILKIIETLHNNSIESFAHRVHTPLLNIQHLFEVKLRTGKYPLPTSNLLLAILTTHPELYAPWLLKGTGEMLLVNMYKNLYGLPAPELREQLAKQNKQIKLLSLTIARIKDALT